MAREDCCVEVAEDLTLHGGIECIHQWIRRANEVLGIVEADESAKPADIELLSNRFKNSLIYLNAPLGVRLEVILNELCRLKDLVGS